MKIKYVLLSILVVIIIAAAGVVLFMENIVKATVNKYGSEIVGTNVELKGFALNPFRGTASIQGLTVANPENYQAPYLFDLGGISVKMDMKSVLTDTIVIEDITVSKPVITYEMLSLNQNNIKQIQENISKNTAPAKTEEKQATKSEDKASLKPAKKVIIRKLTIAEGELQALTSLQKDAAKLDVKLPSIELTDIGGGKSGKGESIAVSISKIMTKILNVATQTVVSNNLGDLKKVAKENLNTAVDSVKDKIKNLGIFGKK